MTSQNVVSNVVAGFVVGKRALVTVLGSTFHSVSA